MSALLYRTRLRAVVVAAAGTVDRPPGRFVADPPGRTAAPPGPAAGHSRAGASRPPVPPATGWSGRVPAWTGPGSIPAGEHPAGGRLPGHARARGARARRCRLAVGLLLAVLACLLAGGIAGRDECRGSDGVGHPAVVPGSRPCAGVVGPGCRLDVAGAEAA